MKTFNEKEFMSWWIEVRRLLLYESSFGQSLICSSIEKGMEEYMTGMTPSEYVKYKIGDEMDSVFLS